MHKEATQRDMELHFIIVTTHQCYTRNSIQTANAVIIIKIITKEDALETRAVE